MFQALQVLSRPRPHLQLVFLERRNINTIYQQAFVVSNSVLWVVLDVFPTVVLINQLCGHTTIETMR